ncbi:MAG: DUF4162 domain-containing protein, partial [Actinomycetia bacterium]|nr:DUF4162 domain-containing protein [Actinomycetes bacterium]
GTNNELKAMIGTGEKIQVEAPELPDAVLDELRRIATVQQASYDGKTLEVRCASGAHNLSTVLDALHSHQIAFGRVYSEPPTLNDVFLEMTGTGLRD